MLAIWSVANVWARFTCSKAVSPLRSATALQDPGARIGGLWVRVELIYSRSKR
jgi:hypothetical protein